MLVQYTLVTFNYISRRQRGSTFIYMDPIQMLCPLEGVDWTVLHSKLVSDMLTTCVVISQYYIHFIAWRNNLDGIGRPVKNILYALSFERF